jgi:hypothetical protein
VGRQRDDGTVRGWKVKDSWEVIDFWRSLAVSLRVQGYKKA